MKKISFIFIAFVNLYSSTVLEYGLGVKYIFDSNIARNITEVSKHNVVPEIDLKYYPFSAVNFFAEAEVIYDFYVKERDVDDNSPFVTGGIGIKLGKKKFRVVPEFYVEQFLMAEGYSLNEDGEFKKDSWIPFLRTFNIKTHLLRKKKKIAISTDACVSYRDYKDNSPEDEGIEVKLEPKIKYLFKGKDKRFRFKSISAAVEYNGRFVDEESKSFNKFMVALKTDIRFWRARLDAAFECGHKTYIGKTEHPHSGKDINETISYLNIKPSIKINLIVNLEFKIGTALRFRNSNFPNEEYNRSTFYSVVKWNSKIKRKKNN